MKTRTVSLQARRNVKTIAACISISVAVVIAALPTRAVGSLIPPYSSSGILGTANPSMEIFNPAAGFMFYAPKIVSYDVVTYEFVLGEGAIANSGLLRVNASVSPKKGLSIAKASSKATRTFMFELSATWLNYGSIIDQEGALTRTDGAHQHALVEISQYVKVEIYSRGNWDVLGTQYEHFIGECSGEDCGTVSGGMDSGVSGEWHDQIYPGDLFRISHELTAHAIAFNPVAEPPTVAVLSLGLALVLLAKPRHTGQKQSAYTS